MKKATEVREMMENIKKNREEELKNVVKTLLEKIEENIIETAQHLNKTVNFSVSDNVTADITDTELQNIYVDVCIAVEDAGYKVSENDETHCLKISW